MDTRHFDLWPLCTEQIIQAVHEKVRRMSIGSNQSLNSVGYVGKETFLFFFVSLETLDMIVYSQVALSWCIFRHVMYLVLPVFLLTVFALNVFNQSWLANYSDVAFVFYMFGLFSFCFICFWFNFVSLDAFCWLTYYKCLRMNNFLCVNLLSYCHFQN